MQAKQRAKEPQVQPRCQGTECEPSSEPRNNKCNHGAEELECRPSIDPRDIVFSFFFLGGAFLSLVLNDNDIMAIPLVNRQVEGLMHCELSEPWGVSQGRFAVSGVTYLDVRRQLEPQIKKFVSDPPRHGTRM